MDVLCIMLLVFAEETPSFNKTHELYSTLKSEYSVNDLYNTDNSFHVQGGLMTEQNQYIEIRNLTKVYGDSVEVRALDDMSLYIESGEFLAIIGLKALEKVL
jgi:ABC-type transport system involved in cytochrome bd biosynthesis fused ATPase/permease subunit